MKKVIKMFSKESVMKLKDPVSWYTALGVGIFASLAILPQAKGELVYENDEKPVLQEQSEGGVVEAPTGATGTVRSVEDRDLTRHVLENAEKAQATVSKNEVASVGSTEFQNLSKSELMRRERMREELKNEDVLQERLEELRLRDERKRTEQIIGSQSISGAIETLSGNTAMQQSPSLQTQTADTLTANGARVTEFVVPPVTERPGQQAMEAPKQINVAQMSMGTSGVVSNNGAAQAANTSVASTQIDTDKTVISIQPRAGLANMLGSNYYNVRPRYSAGIGLGVGASDNLSFELGYTFSEFGVALNSTNPFVLNYQAWSNSLGYSANLETVAMKQNVADAGLKLHFLGSDAKLRPFIGGGAAYSRSYINYDQKILSALSQGGLQGLGRDYEISQFLGYLSSGLDVRMGRTVTFGAVFKYYSVLSSRENQNLNNMALYGAYPYYNNYNYNPYGAYYSGLPDADKQLVGGSLANASFYSAMAGVTFIF
ncbi:MAG: hypothetical protein AAB116_02300 [Candidatus Poribacteria bacterium]